MFYVASLQFFELAFSRPTFRTLKCHTQELRVKAFLRRVIV